MSWIPPLVVFDDDDDDDNDDDDDGFMFYVPFNIIEISRRWKDDNKKALCNEAPYSHRIPPAAASEIRAQDLVIPITKPPRLF